MIKHIKLFLLALYLVAGLPILLDANNSNTSPARHSGKLPVCIYQAPINFHAIEQGTDFIKLAWTPSGPPPPAYNIKTYRVSDGLLVSNVTFPNNTNFKTIAGLDPGTLYYFVLCPVCEDGTFGPIVGTFGQTVIIDLILAGFTPVQEQNPECVITANGNGECTFTLDGNITNFKIWNKNDHSISKIFGLQKDLNTAGHYFVRILTPNSDASPPPPLPEGFSFQCGENVDEQCSTKRIDIEFNRGPILYSSFKVVESTTGGLPILKCISIGSNFEIVKLPGTSNGGGGNFSPSTGRDDTNAENGNLKTATLSASPNPFTNQLDVQIPFSTEENAVQINLYNLQGRLVLSQHTQGGPQIRSLSTEDLIPGLYLLRVDTGDRSETIKVLKTQ